MTSRNVFPALDKYVPIVGDMALKDPIGTCLSNAGNTFLEVIFSFSGA